MTVARELAANGAAGTEEPHKRAIAPKRPMLHLPEVRLHMRRPQGDSPTTSEIYWRNSEYCLRRYDSRYTITPTIAPMTVIR